MKHRPNAKKDTRKARIREGVCSIQGCSRPSGVIYYTFPTCVKCWDYYADLKDADALKRVYKIRDRTKETSLDDFEEDMFD